MAELAFSGNRELHNLRAAFNEAPWLRKVTLRYMLGKISAEDRLEIDGKIGRHLPLIEDRHDGGLGDRRVLIQVRRVVEEAALDDRTQGEVLKCVARKVGVGGLGHLEDSIGKLRGNPDKFRV